MKPGEEEAPIKSQFFDLAEKYFLDAYFYHAQPQYMTKVELQIKNKFSDFLKKRILTQDCQSQ